MMKEEILGWKLWITPLHNIQLLRDYFMSRVNVMTIGEIVRFRKLRSGWDELCECLGIQGFGQNYRALGVAVVVLVSLFLAYLSWSQYLLLWKHTHLICSLGADETSPEESQRKRVLEKAEEQESRGVVGWSGISASILSSLCVSCSYTQLLVSLLVLVITCLCYWN